MGEKQAAAGSTTAAQRRIDVNRLLADMQRALIQVQGASRAVRAMGGETALQRHVERLRDDPGYAATMKHLIEAASEWSGTIAEFVDRYPQVRDLPPDMQPGTGEVRDQRPRAYGGSVPGWATRLRGSMRQHQRAQEGLRTLMRVTAATTPEEAMERATSRQPLLDWVDFEEAVFATRPAPTGLVDNEEGIILNHLIEAIETSRHRMGQAMVERCHAGSAADEIRDRIHRLASYKPMKYAQFDRSKEREIRAALADLGFDRPADPTELAAQIQLALLAHPDNIERLLAMVHKSAEELLEVTETTSIKEGVRKAKQMLKANTSWVERPRSGIVVYSGGLPTLGKRR